MLSDTTDLVRLNVIQAAASRKQHTASVEDLWYTTLRAAVLMSMLSPPTTSLQAAGVGTLLQSICMQLHDSTLVQLTQTSVQTSVQATLEQSTLEHIFETSGGTPRVAYMGRCSEAWVHRGLCLRVLGHQHVDSYV
jgi:hypothetical protein